MEERSNFQVLVIMWLGIICIFNLCFFGLAIYDVAKQIIYSEFYFDKRIFNSLIFMLCMQCGLLALLIISLVQIVRYEYSLVFKILLFLCIPSFRISGWLNFQLDLGPTIIAYITPISFLDLLVIFETSYSFYTYSYCAAPKHDDFIIGISLIPILMLFFIRGWSKITPTNDT